VETVQTELRGKKVILLNGARAEKKTGTAVEIEAPEELLEAARQNPDAVAFGYMSGRWVAAA
jgi:hypothetical protein